MSSSTGEILYDFSPGFIAYKGGRVKRLTGTEVAPASADPHSGTTSKDVVIAPDQNVSARLFLPKNATSSAQKLPLLVYFHGGGFIIESAFSPLYTNHLNSIVSEANVVAVSVEYRLAPEHPLPISYEDSWLALKWVAQGSEPWLLEYADFDRVYLGGDSAGANIAHNMAVRAGVEKLDGVNIVGMFLNCPYFGGEVPVGKECADLKRKTVFDNLWRLAHPSSSGSDDPLFNPAMNPRLSSLGCKKVLVYVAENDELRDRGLCYKEDLLKSGWDGDVEVVDVKGVRHVFNICHPSTDQAISMMHNLAHFLNNGQPS